MRLIVCVEDREQAEIIRRTLAGWPGCEMTFFSSVPELLAHPPQCDIAMLDLTADIAAPARLAGALRARYPAVDLVFLSADPGCATLAFRLDAAQFFLKPVEGQCLLWEFGFLLRKRSERRFRWVVSNKTTAYTLSPAEIEYMEGYHRHLFIHTQGQVIDIRGKMSWARDVLEAYGFCQCHQGFLINLQRIRSVGRSQLVCASGKVIPISERKRPQFLRRYAQFLQT